MTVQIIEFHGDEKRYVDALLKAQQRTQELEAELKKAGKASQDAAGAVGDAFKQTEQEQARVMNALRAQLRAIGPEGSAAAKAMSESMATGGRESEVAVNELLDKIKLIDPVAAEAARAGFQTAKDEMAEASRFGEGAFQKPLDKLRAMGPEGRKAAELLKAHLVDSGKVVERSMADVVDEIRKIDPAAAEAAQKIQNELQDSADESAEAWDLFGKRSVAAVTTLAGTYLSFSSTIQLVNRYLEDQVRLQEKAKDVQLTFASAQQATLTNLAGFSEEDQNFLVGDAVPQIGTNANFGDNVRIIEAIGAVASSGVEDKNQIIDVVTESAKVTNLNPDQLKGMSVSVAGVMKQGELTAKEALSLVTTTGPLSKIEEIDRLGRVLPVVLSSVRANTEGLTPQQASKEAASMFAVVGNAAGDELGDSTKTFMIGISTKLNTFFNEMEVNRAKSKDEVANIEERISKGKETETDKLSLPKLKAFLAETENLTDSGGMVSRFKQLQDLPATAGIFKDKVTVESQFQPSLAKLLDPTDPLLQQVSDGIGKLSTDPAVFDKFAARMQGATRQTKLASTEETSNANTSEFMQGGATDVGARMAQVRKLMNDTSDTLRSSMAFGESFAPYLEDTKDSLATKWSFDSPAVVAGRGVLKFASQNATDARDGLTDTEAKRTKYRNQQMALLVRDFIMKATPEEASQIMGEIKRATGEGQSMLGAGNRMAFDSNLQQDQTMIQMMELLQTIAANTAATAGNTQPGEAPSSLPPLSAAP